MSLSDEDREWIQNTITKTFAKAYPPPKKRKSTERKTRLRKLLKIAAALFGGARYRLFTVTLPLPTFTV